MPRNGTHARLRLQQAALDLYREQGYAKTTTAQIAERAGVTERTFFRHFSDKREVLFDGEAELLADLERGVREAPASMDPLSVLFCAFQVAIPLFERNRAFAQPRNEVISVTPALRERALIKEASLTQALASALLQRGVADATSVLAAHIGMAALTQATLTWFDQADQDLDVLFKRALDDVRDIASHR